jgi:hypothetical protein
MGGNLSSNYMFSVFLMLAGLSYTGNLIYTRLKRKEILKKHKPGTTYYEHYQRLLSSRYLAISVTITLLLIANTINDVRTIVHLHALSESFTLISRAVVSTIIFSFIYITIYIMARRRGGAR